MKINWIKKTKEGIQIKNGQFYIDPIYPVQKAIVTHAHADHARSGHYHVIGTHETIEIMKTRYGENFCKKYTCYKYNQKFKIDGVDLFLAPAGHVLGSAQIVMDFNNQRVTVAGDYKRQYDPTCSPFEPIKSDVFVTEATFGLPVFKHPDAKSQIEILINSIKKFPDRCHVIGVYSLGKAQRLIKMMRDFGWNDTIYIHGSLVKICELYKKFGIDLGKLEPATIQDKPKKPHEYYKGKLILAPPSALSDIWSRRFPDPIIGMASGWMTVKQRAKQRGVNLPLILSDHADWNDILKTIEQVSPKEVWVTHGSEEALIYECEKRNLSAKALSLVGYESDNDI